MHITPFQRTSLCGFGPKGFAGALSTSARYDHMALTLGALVSMPWAFTLPVVPVLTYLPMTDAVRLPACEVDLLMGV